MNVFNIGIEKLIDSDEQNSRNNDKQKKNHNNINTAKQIRIFGFMFPLDIKIGMI